MKSIIISILIKILNCHTIEPGALESFEISFKRAAQVVNTRRCFISSLDFCRCGDDDDAVRYGEGERLPEIPRRYAFFPFSASYTVH